MGFLRNFDGFLVSCGLDHIAVAKARLLSYGVDEERGKIVCGGIVRQASVFGEVLEHRRRITLSIWTSELLVDDAVSNPGFRPAHHAIIYHLNFGYPFFDENLQISGLPEPILVEIRSAKSEGRLWATSRCG